MYIVLPPLVPVRVSWVACLVLSGERFMQSSNASILLRSITCCSQTSTPKELRVSTQRMFEASERTHVDDQTLTDDSAKPIMLKKMIAEEGIKEEDATHGVDGDRGVHLFAETEEGVARQMLALIVKGQENEEQLQQKRLLVAQLASQTGLCMRACVRVAHAWAHGQSGFQLLGLKIAFFYMPL